MTSKESWKGGGSRFIAILRMDDFELGRSVSRVSEHFGRDFRKGMVELQKLHLQTTK